MLSAKSPFDIRCISNTEPRVKVKQFTYLYSFASPFQAKPLEVKHEPADNHSVTISWRKPETAPGHAAYVVELYPEGYKLEELRWVRVSRKDTRTVITGGTFRVTVNTGGNNTHP